MLFCENILKNIFILHNNLKHFGHHLWQNLENGQCVAQFFESKRHYIRNRPNVSFRCAPNENENDFHSAKIIFVLAPTNRCDFAIVSLSREVETLSTETAAKTEDLLCFFDLFESFSSIMSPGNRNKLR